MKPVAVEIFEQEDVRLETAEQSAEALEIINSLGLEGQKGKSSTETATLKRFPYRLMTNEEAFVYNVLCPSKTELKRYDLSPVPLEVLKTAAYATSLCDSRLAYLEVWAADSSRVKDPVLVGRKSSWGGEIYILARWGEELLPLDVLIPDAIKRWWSSRSDKLNEIIATAQMELSRECPQSCPRSESLPTMHL